MTSLLGPLMNRWMCKSYHASHDGETWQEQPRAVMSVDLASDTVTSRARKLVEAIRRRK